MSAVHKLITDHLDIWTAAETEKKSGRGRASGNANNVYGIKKLRELILELAVRGKLVPQDSNDEPAGDLLKRILAEKAKLVAEGKIKKDKPLATMTEGGPFELPPEWLWVRIGDVATYVQRGKGPDYAEASDFEVVSQKCVRWNGLDLTQTRFITPESISKYEPIRLLKKGDLLWNSTGTGTIGRACLVPQLENEKILVADSHVTVVRTIELLEVFLWRWIQSPSVQSEIEGVASGTTNQIELNTSTVVSHPLPLPPLEEQHRIVAKVDELMALCDQLEAHHNNAADAHEQLVSHLLSTLTQSQDAEDFNANWQRVATHFDTLFTTESSIDALKQTLLQLAVMGKLVPQDPNDEPASELLKRIKVEKSKLVAEGKIKKDKPLAEISEDEKLFDVPIGWALVRKAAVFKFLNGYAFKSETFQSSGVKLLRNVNISHGFADWRDVAHISNIQAQEFEEYSLNVGDIVLTLDRPIITTGLKFAVISKSDVPCLLLQRVAKISSFSESVISNYLSIWLQSAFFTSKIDPGRSNGVPHISTTQVSNMLFALPPVVEQHRIVAKVGELMTLCEQLKNHITDANQYQKKLANILVEQVLA